MKKIALVLACIALPLAALAAKPDAETTKTDNKPAVKADHKASAKVEAKVDAKALRPAVAASAASAAAVRHEHIQPAVAAASDVHGNARLSKERGSLMGVCRQQVAEQGLSGTAYRAAVADCMNKPAS